MGRSPIPEKIRIAAYERDNYTCQDCGHVGVPGQKRENIQAHHIKPQRAGGAHTLNNLKTLCVPCHAEVGKETRHIASSFPILPRPKVTSDNYRWLMIEGAKRGLTPGRFLNALLDSKKTRKAILTGYDGDK